MQKLEWHETTLNINQLKPFDKNPRYITKDQFKKLKQSIEDSGYNQRLLIDTDYTIIGGHQRYQVFKEIGLSEIKVLIPNRKLTEKEFERINIQDNIGFGNWDLDVLSSCFEIHELIDWGIDTNLFSDLAVEEETEIKETKQSNGQFRLEIISDLEEDLMILKNELEERGYRCRL